VKPATTPSKRSNYQTYFINICRSAQDDDAKGE
jgi:hypothetical protein